MASFLKHIWFFTVMTGVGLSWLLITILILGETPTFISNYEERLIASLFLPGILFIFGGHLVWMLSENWLNPK